MSTESSRLMALIRSTPNRGSTHIFLGHPLSDGCDKTTVEPGNVYSPGVWTCGVSLWFEVEGQVFTPDLLPVDGIAWAFGNENVTPPIVESRYHAGPLAVVHRLAHLGTEGAEGVDFNEVAVLAMRATQGTLTVVVRDVGPAGGKIRSMEWLADEQTLLVNQGLRLVMETPGAGCEIVPADPAHDSPLALIRLPLNLAARDTAIVRFRTEHGFAERFFGKVIPAVKPFAGLPARAGIERAATEWTAMLPARVFAPDPRVAQVWERCAFHILAAMECGLPRIGAVNYPVLWLRDCVIVLRALDFMGRHDLARIGNDYVAGNYFSGGFGAESDAPGEGIWSLVSHARATHDVKWLKVVFPYIRQRVEWLDRMLTATRPVRALSENRVPFLVNTPGINILALPAVDGCIHGRMDGHHPDFFINAWSVCGYRLAAEAALRVGQKRLAARWAASATRLEAAMFEHLLPKYGNDRDPIITPYPSGALLNHVDALRAKFADWYRKKRLTPEGKRRPEKLWTYFEAAQIHNAFLLGLREEAWTSLVGMLGPEDAWDVSAYIEGSPGGNELLPFRNGEERRGWLAKDALGGNMPHNWTSAEMVTLIRDLFVTEAEDGVVLGQGVPRAWLRPGNRFGVTAMPTDLGPVSYTAEVGADGTVRLDYHGPTPYRTAWPEA